MYAARNRRSVLDRPKIVQKFFGKNTGDLQWKMRANYNARLCAGLRKSAGARTMDNNEKTMRGATEPSENPGECLRPWEEKIRKKEQADYRTPWR
jgi:hypothetical protein